MSNRVHSVDTVPIWAGATPFAAVAFLSLLFFDVVPSTSNLVLVAAAILLGTAVFASVHHAEIIALRVGEPFGSLVLAIAVTVIEVSLIVSIMLSATSGSEALARDTVFATVMIVLNGIVGMCLLLGGAQFREQSFRTDASSSALSVLGTLAVLALVLPNYTLATSDPTFSPAQLLFVGIVSIVLYSVFLFVQTIRHRDYFLSDAVAGNDMGDGALVPSLRTMLVSMFFLIVALAAVVLLAKVISPSIEGAVSAAGLPKAFVGVVIAAVVLMPEGLASVHAARRNQLQKSLNLALGSAMATIGLTIPVVAVVSLVLGQPIVLGLGPEAMVLLLLTLFISTVTLATGRTTILQGAVHLVIFAVFLFLSAIP